MEGFGLTAELSALVAEAEDVAHAAASDRAVKEDSWLIGYDRAFTEWLGARGWIGMTWPAAVGGGGRAPIERFLVYEQLIKHGAPVCAGWFADRQIGPTILEFGTDDQKVRWLPDIIAGRSMWCIGLSEPDAGSDLASVRTQAVRSDGHWVVTGQKVWTSGAAVADWCYCVVRTDPQARPHEGLSELVIDMRSPGVEVRPIVDMTGNDHFCEVRLDKVRVPADHLVGTENGSFRQVMRQMELERGGIDRLVSNFALYRDVLTTPGLVDRTHPVTRQAIARIETTYRVGRLMMLREATRQAPPGFSAATKVLGTEFEQVVSNFCANQLGPSALLWDHDAGLGGRASRSVAYAPAYTIMGGTTNVLRNILAERVLGLPR